MYANAAHWSFKEGSADEVVTINRDVLIPELASLAGFAQSVTIQTGTDSFLTVFLWESEAEADKSVEHVTPMVRERLGHLLEGMDRYRGPVLDQRDHQADTAVVDAHEAAEAAHDAAAVAATFHHDGVLEPKPTGRSFVGPDQITGFYMELFTAFPNLQSELVRRCQSGRTVTDELVFRGTHQGTFLGIPATGKTVEVPACVVYDLDGDSVSREAAYWDVATMLIQMGVLAPPA